MGQDYVVVGRDGTLSVVSGETGQIRELKDQELKTQVLDLIKQRQDAGKELTKLLGQHGLSDNVSAIDVTGVIGPELE